MDEHQTLAKAEIGRRQVLADKRLRGHGIKHGLDELGELDAAPARVASPAADQRPSKKARKDTTVTVAAAAPHKMPDSSSGPAASRDSYMSVFGAGWSAWRSVKKRLFSPAAAPSAKLAALEEVALWHARVRRHRAMPSYVESTELLMRCVLLDETAATATTTTGPPHDLSAAYGAALARTVHVMTGSFASGAANTYRKRAREIGFPEEAVEVRQRVAHGAALPSLSELRWACGLVLQFLCQQYWVEQERQVRLMEEDGEIAREESELPATAMANKAKNKKSRKEKKQHGALAAFVTSAAAAAPSTSVAEMEDLLAQLESGGDDGDVGPKSVPLPHSSRGRGTNEATTVTGTGRHVYAGGWTVS